MNMKNTVVTMLGNTDISRIGGPLQAIFLECFLRVSVEILKPREELIFIICYSQKRMHIQIDKSETNTNLYQTSLQYASMNFFF